MKRAASAAQLPTTAGGAITSAGPPPTVRARWARTVGVLPRPMSRARQPPSSTASRKPSQPSASAWYERSSPTKPSGRVTGAAGAAVAFSSRSVTQPLPSTVSPAPKGVPSRPTTWRRISAPVIWSAPARSARAAAASFRSTRSSSTHLPCERTSGRASAARRATSAAVSSTSSKTADQRTSLSWLAPTTVSPVGSTKRRRAGVGLRRDSAGTRTSKPAASRAGPVTVMSSHASSWLRYTCPRRRPPARPSLS